MDIAPYNSLVRIASERLLGQLQHIPPATIRRFVREATSGTHLSAMFKCISDLRLCAPHDHESDQVSARLYRTFITEARVADTFYTLIFLTEREIHIPTKLRMVRRLLLRACNLEEIVELYHVTPQEHTKRVLARLEEIAKGDTRACADMYCKIPRCDEMKPVICRLQRVLARR